MTSQRTNWTGVAFGLCLSFLAAYHLFKLPPVLPVLLEAYDYDRTLAGGFMSVYALAGLTLSLWLGRVLEQRGVAGPVLIALTLMLVGNGLVLAWPHLGWLVLGARALEGTAFAVLAIAGPLLANTQTSRHHLPLVIGLTATWIPVGQMTAGLLAPGALAVQGWQTLWGFGIGFTLLVGVWTLRLRAGDRIDLGPRRARSARDGRAAAPITRREHLGLLLAAAIFMLWSGQYFAYMTWLPQYLVEVMGLTVSQALGGYLVPVIVLLVFNVLTGAVLRAGVPLGPLMTVALASQAVVWWLQPVIGGGWAGIGALVAYGIGAGITPTCLFALPSVIAGPQRSAPAFGIIMTGRNLGVLIGPILLAQAFELAGTWDISAPIFGSLTAFATLVAGVLAVRLARSDA